MPEPKAKLEPYTNPFTVLVDSNEGQPFSFQGLFADADKDYRPLVVPLRRMNLGRFPNSLGDYSLEGYYGRCHVERKSMEDAWSTLLGWETDYEKKTGNVSHRERFKKELDNLSKLDAAMVVVEASFQACLEHCPPYGTKSAETNRKSFHRTLHGMLIDFHVPFLFCDDRRLAEVATFRFLERFYRKQKEKERAAKKAAKASIADMAAEVEKKRVAEMEKAARKVQKGLI